MRARLDLSQEGRVIRMAKAMLIMDMPSSCEECDFFKELRWNRHYCTQKNCKEIEGYVSDFRYEKPYWCPLHEVPQKMEKYHEIALGYNACIDEILGGGE